MKIPSIYTYKPDKGRLNTQPSEAIPDQTMSMREIMERYAKGAPLTNVKTPVYFGEDEEYPDVKKMDLVEIQEMKERAQESIESIKKSLDYQAKQRNEAKEKTTLSPEKKEEKKEEKTSS